MVFGIINKALILNLITFETMDEKWSLWLFISASTLTLNHTYNLTITPHTWWKGKKWRTERVSEEGSINFAFPKLTTLLQHLYSFPEKTHDQDETMVSRYTIVIATLYKTGGLNSINVGDFIFALYPTYLLELSEATYTS